MSYTQPPPPPPPPGFGPPPVLPAPRPGWARKRVLIPVAVVILLLGVGIGSAGNGGDGEKTSAEPAPTVTVTARAEVQADDEAEPAPTVTVTRTAKAKADTADTADAAPSGKAVFKVWGSAPSGLDITYGSDGTNLEGKGLPLKKTLTVDEDSLYYQVTAQLMGGGDIQCSVTIDGKTKTGRAQGGYNICSAQLNSDFSGGFS
ncbi:hypothetical protein [Streptomyces fulvoviolaceus]|uniref:hypothetical protein n=1 Tax=Streptomyces fulvoviolaceus TaxID=285535 RepID=UPI001F2CC908|nr:hypothetical protein [Streptomyces fulvoviolaceus]MCT9084780.1 hypothetical protein [Streptomyces fulvoviolaceus]